MLVLNFRKKIIFLTIILIHFILEVMTVFTYRWRFLSGNPFFIVKSNTFEYISG